MWADNIMKDFLQFFANVDLARTVMDVLLVLFGFFMAMAWDLIKDKRAWYSLRNAVVEELKANQAHINLRFRGLPEAAQKAIKECWTAGKVSIPSEILKKFPALSLGVELKTSVWDSVVANGHARQLLGNFSTVATAYDKIRFANHHIASCLPLFELSLNIHIEVADRDAFRHASQTAALSPEIYCLPAINAALEKITS